MSAGWPYVPPDADGWPSARATADKTEVLKAKLEVRKKRTDQEIARAKAYEDARDAVSLEYYKAVLEVAKGSIDRARASAEIVQKASAAIVTLYTAVLAVAFSAADNPLPGKALFAAVLLGVAILLSTAFLAWVPEAEPKDEREVIETSAGDTLGAALTSLFVRWTRKAALQRGRLLKGSVVALAGAVALMPAPFVTIGGNDATAAGVDWPALDSAGVDTNIELQKILYTAQVAEAAEERKQPAARDEEEWVWWGIAVFAGVLTVGVMLFPWQWRLCPRRG
jgi:hypothetical protein